MAYKHGVYTSAAQNTIAQDSRAIYGYYNE